MIRLNAYNLFVLSSKDLREWTPSQITLGSRTTPPPPLTPLLWIYHSKNATPTMKKTIYALLLLALLPACNSFLEEYSQDRRVPKDVNEFSEILFGEAYFDDILPFHYLDLLTDDVKAEHKKQS